MKKAKKLSGVSFIRAFIPFIRGAPSWLDHPQRPHSKYHHLVIQHINFEGTQTFSLSVQLRRSVMSNSLWPCEPQHAGPPCPSPTPRVHPNPCPLSQWCHPTISSCRPLLLLPSIFASIRVFSNESALRIRTKVLEFQLQHHPSNEHPGLISFRMDWLDLLAVQGTLKSLLQHHSSKASILLHSAFFLVQLSHPYMTTGKSKVLTRQTFVGKVTSLLFNMMSSLVMTFLLRKKCLFISWLKSPSAVILEQKK